MKIHYKYAMVGILLLVVFLSGCVQRAALEKTTSISLGKTYYNIVSEVNYERSLCGDISNHHQPSGFNTGVRIILKDKDTGKKLNGYATISMKGGGGTLTLDDAYTCEEQIKSESAVISAYSRGYAPITFKLGLPKNKLVTIEVSMFKSCSGGPSCFDNIWVELLGSTGGNEAKAESLLESERNKFFSMIQQKFGLKKSNYVLSCIECNMKRDGYIKAKGTYKDGSLIELYYHWEWCSSGGVDCGWELCFSSTSDELFEHVKANVCSKLASKQYKTKCLSGNYEKVIGEKKILSLRQISNEHGHSMDKGNFNCMAS